MITTLTQPLADRINREFDLTQQATKIALGHAMNCGDALIEAKGVVDHGQWVPWLESNTVVSVRSSQRYMKLANHREELEAKYDTDVVFGISEAVKLIAKPREEKDTGGRLKDLSLERRREVVSWEHDPENLDHRYIYELRMGACMMLEADGYDLVATADYLGIDPHQVRSALSGEPLPEYYQRFFIVEGEEPWYSPEDIDLAVAHSRLYNLSRGALTATSMARLDNRHHLCEELDQVYYGYERELYR